MAGIEGSQMHPKTSKQCALASPGLNIGQDLFSHASLGCDPVTILSGNQDSNSFDVEPQFVLQLVSPGQHGSI